MKTDLYNIFSLRALLNRFSENHAQKFLISGKNKIFSVLSSCLINYIKRLCILPLNVTISARGCSSIFTCLTLILNGLFIIANGMGIEIGICNKHEEYIKAYHLTIVIADF